jgi:hypothetical protein
VQKSILHAAIQKEIHRHDFSYFVDEPPSVARAARASSLLAARPVEKELIQ